MSDTGRAAIESEESAAAALGVARSAGAVQGGRLLSFRVTVTWLLSEGVEGRGADEAANSSAVLVEWCKVHAIESTGGPADMLKCIDQILHPLLYRILKEAGMPKRVLGAYRRFLVALQVHNNVAGGIGEA